MSEECCGDPGDCARPCVDERGTGWVWLGDETHVFANDDLHVTGARIKEVLENAAQRTARDEEIALSHDATLGVVVCLRCHRKQGNALGDDVFYVGCARCNHPYARYARKLEVA